MNDDTNQRAREDTVSFVQDWLMSSDYEPTQWDRDFAAAIDARVTSVREEALREAAEIANGLAKVASALKLKEGVPCNTCEAWRRVEDGAEDIRDEILSLITGGGGRG